MSHRPAGVTGERFLRAIRSRAIEIPQTCEILVGRSRVAVRLPDGSIGTGMDYSRYGPRGAEPEPLHVNASTARILDGAPDGLPGSALQATAVYVALLAALSRPFLEDPALRADGLRSGRCTYPQQRRHPIGGLSRDVLTGSLDGASSVGVVGYGGFMEMYAGLDQVERVLVCDRDLEWRADRVQATVRRLNTAHGTPKITFIGDDLKRVRDECDVVQITASALCNGSMDELLDTLHGVPLVVVGPSGALVPAEWMALGARLICTELRAADYWWAYRFDDHAYDWYAEYDDRIYIW